MRSFDAVACMGLQTALIGYSSKKDLVIQYPIVLSSGSNAQKSEEISFWIDYLFSKQQSGQRFWKYEIDYRGRNGTLDKYEIRYNAQLERFEGTLSSTREEPE